MPTKAEPRVTLRLSESDHAILSAAASAKGVALGSLIREAAIAYARDLANGDVKPLGRMRRQPPVARPVRSASSVPASEHDRVMLARQAALNKARDRK